MDTKYIKNIIRSFLIVSIAIAATVYIIANTFGNTESSIATELALSTTQNDILALDGYIFRNEVVLYAQKQGGISSLYKDGEKVPVGTQVASVYSMEDINGIRSKMIRIDNKISILEKSNLSEHLTVNDTSAVDAQIKSDYLDILKELSVGNIGDVLNQKDDLLISLNKRLIITRVVENYHPQITALNAEKAALIASLDNVVETVVSPQAGYYYSQADGYENIFSSQKIDDLTLEDFLLLTGTQPEKQSNRACAGKIVVDFHWYLACVADKEDLAFFEETGTFYQIIFPQNSDEQIEMELYNTVISYENPSQILLIFKTNKNPEEFDYIRKQEIQIVRKSYTGYKVPSSAIRVIEGETGVYILSGNIVRFRKIEILYEHSNYVIVKERDLINDPDYKDKLALKESIILKGKNLYDGKVINTG